MGILKFFENYFRFPNNNALSPEVFFGFSTLSISTSILSVFLGY